MTTAVIPAYFTKYFPVVPTIAVEVTRELLDGLLQTGVQPSCNVAQLRSGYGRDPSDVNEAVNLLARFGLIALDERIGYVSDDSCHCTGCNTLSTWLELSDPLPLGQLEVIANKQLTSKRLTEIERERVRCLRDLGHERYLMTPDWHARRLHHLERAGFRCQLCNQWQGEKLLQVHHRTYERLGAEDYEDLIVLCPDCHKLFHENPKFRARWHP